jgi:hypothetical protein
VSNNFAGEVDAEQAAIRRALQGTRLIFPSHCAGGRLEHGRVVSRLDAPEVPA